MVKIKKNISKLLSTMLSTFIALSNVLGFLIYLVKITKYISNKQTLHICDNTTESKKMIENKNSSAIVCKLKTFVILVFVLSRKIF